MSDDKQIYIKDGVVDIISHHRARHQGILVSFFNGPEMHVTAKDSKQSLRFDLTSSTGMSASVEGLLGHSIRPAEYHIDENGAIFVEGRKITGAKRIWMDHGYCHVLTGHDVFTFMGKTPADFLVDNSITGIFYDNVKPK